MTVTNANSIWNKVLESSRSYQRASLQFVALDQRLDILRAALKGPDRMDALIVARSLSLDDLKALLPELLEVSRSSHGPFQAAWDLLLRLPRQWLVANAPPLIERILDAGEECDYWMFLNLATQIDEDFAKGLAQRAIRHTDSEIQELGRDFLSRLPS